MKFLSSSIFFKVNKKRKKWFAIAFVVGCVEIFAFVISIGVTIIQISSLPDSTFMQGIESIISAIKFRTVAFVEQQDIQRYVPAIVNALEKGRFEVVTDYLKSSEELWFAFSIKEICKCWLTSVVVRFLVDALCEKKWRKACWNFNAMPVSNGCGVLLLLGGCSCGTLLLY